MIKPKHSAFFETGLDLLLKYLEVENLVLAGMAGDNCVYFTAADAYLRDYGLFVPSDCTFSISPAENRDALKRMRRILKVDTTPAAKLLKRKRLLT
ncbi:MAG: cysteine hydrolase [Proteobacteria bacterium]|nr:MAG: cysteine hydrolase [Pseudomonadota bacterium]